MPGTTYQRVRTARLRSREVGNFDLHTGVGEPKRRPDVRSVLDPVDKETGEAVPEVKTLDTHVGGSVPDAAQAAASSRD